MRISDWSSDVCSSDLQRLTFRGIAVIDASQRIDALSPIRFGEILAAGSGELAQRSDTIAMLGPEVAPRADRSWAVVQGIEGGREHHFRDAGAKREFEIGRASGRERACTYVWTTVVGDAMKNK